MARIDDGGEGRRDELVEDEPAEEDVYEVEDEDDDEPTEEVACVVEDEDDYVVDEEELLREMEALGAKKRSRQREEIEAALKAAMKRSDAGEGALILLNLDGGEAVYFDGYPEALEYMAGRKGRWYLAPRGIDREAVGSRQEADGDRSVDRR
ncbi:MAG: hypothetical protein METHAR1v1_280012 [Methanothrix sp.]|jgi:hypothetical protein|nr:MAG: hypothetical protein METHAR1v1_280012 [Methanothrix sp.]